MISIINIGQIYGFLECNIHVAILHILFALYLFIFSSNFALLFVFGIVPLHAISVVAGDGYGAMVKGHVGVLWYIFESALFDRSNEI